VTQRQIAEAVGVSRETVRTDLLAATDKNLSADDAPDDQAELTTDKNLSPEPEPEPEPEP
jgi:hypothetical protein